MAEDTKNIKKEKKERKASFSSSIINLVGLCFGIVFLVIFIASIIFLLSEYKYDLESYYSRVGIVFGVFLLAYLGVSILVSKRIRNMMAPLDQLAHGLLENKIKVYGDSDDFSCLAESLKKEMIRLEKVSSELKETQENLTELSDASDKNKEQIQAHTKNSLKAYEVIAEQELALEKEHRRSLELREDITPVEEKLRVSRKSMMSMMKTMDTAVKDGLKNCEQSVEDIKLTSDADATMQNMLSESVELIGNLYDELSYMQDLMNKLTLLATNSTLEAVRSGALGLTMAATLEEVKKLTNDISAKNDEATLLSIRIKNSVKLAKEQAQLCSEKLLDSNKKIEENGEVFKVISEQSTISKQGFENSANGIGLIIEKIFDLSDVFDREQQAIASIKDNLQILGQELSFLKPDNEEQ